MRPLLIVGIVVAITAGTAAAMWWGTREEREFARTHPWTMYSRPLASGSGWTVGVERERYEAPPARHALRAWSYAPPESERLDAEQQAILMAVRFNERKVGR